MLSRNIKVSPKVLWVLSNQKWALHCIIQQQKKRAPQDSKNELIKLCILTRGCSRHPCGALMISVQESFEIRHLWNLGSPWDRGSKISGVCIHFCIHKGLSQIQMICCNSPGCQVEPVPSEGYCWSLSGVACPNFKVMTLSRVKAV